jgi:hypothetical protein
VNHGRPELRGIGGRQRCFEGGQGRLSIGGGHGDCVGMPCSERVTGFLVDGTASEGGLHSACFHRVKVEG